MDRPNMVIEIVTVIALVAGPAVGLGSLFGIRDEQRKELPKRDCS
jgi:hypothetical protein